MLGESLDAIDPPEVSPAAAIVWQAFDELSPMRSVGFAGGERLRLPDIIEYGRVFLGLTSQDDLIMFSRMIFSLDEAFMSRIHERAEADRKRAERKRPVGTTGKRK